MATPRKPRPDDAPRRDWGPEDPPVGGAFEAAAPRRGAVDPRLWSGREEPLYALRASDEDQYDDRGEAERDFEGAADDGYDYDDRDGDADDGVWAADEDAWVDGGAWAADEDAWTEENGWAHDHASWGDGDRADDRRSEGRASERLAREDLTHDARARADRADARGALDGRTRRIADRRADPGEFGDDDRLELQPSQGRRRAPARAEGASRGLSAEELTPIMRRREAFEHDEAEDDAPEMAPRAPQSLRCFEIGLALSPFEGDPALSDPDAIAERVVFKLWAEGRIKGRAIEQARREAKGSLRMDQALARLRLADPEDVAAALAQEIGAPLAEDQDFPDEPVALSALPKRFAADAFAVPLADDGERLALAMADPLDDFTLRAIAMKSKRQLLVMVGCAKHLEREIARIYRNAPLEEEPPAPRQIEAPTSARRRERPAPLQLEARARPDDDADSREIEGQAFERREARPRRSDQEASDQRSFDRRIAADQRYDDQEYDDRDFGDEDFDRHQPAREGRLRADAHRQVAHRQVAYRQVAHRRTVRSEELRRDDQGRDGLERDDLHSGAFDDEDLDRRTQDRRRFDPGEELARDAFDGSERDDDSEYDARERAAFPREGRERSRDFDREAGGHQTDRHDAVGYETDRDQVGRYGADAGPGRALMRDDAPQRAARDTFRQSEVEPEPRAAMNVRPSFVRPHRVTRKSAAGRGAAPDPHAADSLDFDPRDRDARAADHQSLEPESREARAVWGDLQPDPERGETWGEQNWGEQNWGEQERREEQWREEERRHNDTRNAQPQRAARRALESPVAVERAAPPRAGVEEDAAPLEDAIAAARAEGAGPALVEADDPARASDAAPGDEARSYDPLDGPNRRWSAAAGGSEPSLKDQETAPVRDAGEPAADHAADLGATPYAPGSIAAQVAAQVAQRRAERERIGGPQASERGRSGALKFDEIRGHAAAAHVKSGPARRKILEDVRKALGESAVGAKPAPSRRERAAARAADGANAAAALAIPASSAAKPSAPKLSIPKPPSLRSPGAISSAETAKALSGAAVTDAARAALAEANELQEGLVLFVGSHAAGKMEAARALSERRAGDGAALHRFDEADAPSPLIGGA
ncbi:MAG: hypothetical protein AAGM38_03155, partial [Pseudomonadota bacterium]